jgi:hypothetical protein
MAINAFQTTHQAHAAGHGSSKRQAYILIIIAIIVFIEIILLSMIQLIAINAKNGH